MKNQALPTLYILDSSGDVTGAFICAKNEALLMKKDFKIVIVLPTISKIDSGELVNFSKVLQLPIFNIRKSIGSILIYIPMLFVSGWMLRQEMKKDECQYLQINDYYLMQGVISRLFGFRGKIITWVRIDPRRYGSFFSKYWLKLAYRTSNYVVSVSNFIFNILPESEKNVLIYDPVVMKSIRNSKEQQKNRNIVYIGNYVEGKGQQYAIKAFEKIASLFPDVELHFYGGFLGLDKNKNYKEKLKKQAKMTPFFSRIYFHGFAKNTASILSHAYMALNFSESESFSMTCLEASYEGVSLIATKSGGPEEIVINNKTGYLVDKGNLDQMVLAMTELLSDPYKNKTFGKEGASHVRKKFSAEIFKNSIKNLYISDHIDTKNQSSTI